MEGGERGPSSGQLDEDLYSRQLYVLGRDAMARMAASDVLISGLGGLGVEIAKNVILSGVKSVTLHDTKLVTQHDLTTQFFLRATDVGTNRAKACQARLAELNTYVTVTIAGCHPLDEHSLRGLTAVVLTDSSLEEKLAVSALCRSLGVAFISASTRGLFGQLFCDFGDNFVVVDEDGREPVTFPVTDVTREECGVVTGLAQKGLGLHDGDHVTFSSIKGMTQLNDCTPTEVKVLSPLSFSIGDTRHLSAYEGGGIVKQVKIPKTIHFQPLKDSLAAPSFVETDYSKPGRSQLQHMAFQALDEYVKREKGSFPRSWNEEDAEKFLKVFHSLHDASPVKGEVDEEIVKTFSKISRGELAPMNSVIGSIASQEVMKACSGKFSPIYQWLYFDALECLPEHPLDRPGPGGDWCPSGSRYDAQVAVFGRSLLNKLGSLKVFVVGAGAIGCELLKNFAMMGVGAVAGGRITVTDGDHIEKSNLNRQFLFRPWDVKKSKSEVAAAAVNKMNPEISIIAHQVRVGPESEHIYCPEFYESLDVVANALDNVETRRYVDRCCWYYRKPMLDSGTLGTRGSVQVVLPHLTDRYSAQQGSKQEAIPMCTLRSFPNCIEHTLQWARDMFEGEFWHSPKAAKQYLEEADFLERCREFSEHEHHTILATLTSALVDDAPSSFSHCVAWARRHWETNFQNQIIQLLEYFPPDYVMNTGGNFWSVSKHCPHPLTFDASNPLHLDYIVAAANLRAQVYNIPQLRDRLEIAKLAAAVQVPEYFPEARKESQVDDEEAEENLLSARLQKVSLTPLRDALACKERFRRLKITPLAFEKDDDANFHIDFILAASNLRAENYDIEAADRQKSKLIAGKIIPAIATSTALVAGLVSLELLKVCQSHSSIHLYRNISFNLALPFLVISHPSPPPQEQYNDVSWTTWDRFEVQGDLTVAQFVEYFQLEHGVEVTMVAHGDLTLYSNLFKPQERTRRLNQTLTEILEELTGGDQKSWSRAVMLDLGANDKNGEFVSVPHVHYTVQRV